MTQAPRWEEGRPRPHRRKNLETGDQLFGLVALEAKWKFPWVITVPFWQEDTLRPHSCAEPAGDHGGFMVLEAKCKFLLVATAPLWQEGGHTCLA